MCRFSTEEEIDLAVHVLVSTIEQLRAWLAPQDSCVSEWVGSKHKCIHWVKLQATRDGYGECMRWASVDASMRRVKDQEGEGFWAP